MMTSNRPLEDWGKLIGDVPAASAILDRFLERSELIQITGRSYRLRNRSEGASRGGQAKLPENSKTDTSDPRVEPAPAPQKGSSRKRKKPGSTDK